MSKFQIRSPAAYKNAWEHRFGADDVDISPRLLATIYTPESPDLGKNYLYPKGFYYAWCFSHSNLALFLELNRLYGGADPTPVTVGMLEIAGFPGLEADFEGYLAVYTLPDSEKNCEALQVLVPTLPTWLRILDDIGIPVPLAAAIELTRRYSRLGADQDVVDVYSELSGLSRQILTNLGYAPVDPNADEAWKDYRITTERQQKYKEFIQSLGKSPYAGKSSEVDKVGAMTLAGLQLLPQILAPMDPKKDLDSIVMAVRAALAQAQDASALCTLAGVGYNTYPNPFVCKPRSKQTIAERYTGREFILLNRKLDECGEYVSIELKAENPKRPYLDNGWC